MPLFGKSRTSEAALLPPPAPPRRRARQEEHRTSTPAAVPQVLRRLWRPGRCRGAGREALQIWRPSRRPGHARRGQGRLSPRGLARERPRSRREERRSGRLKAEREPSGAVSRAGRSRRRRPPWPIWPRELGIATGGSLLFLPPSVDCKQPRVLAFRRTSENREPSASPPLSRPLPP